MQENLKIPSKLLEPMILAGCLRNASLFLKVKPYLFTSSKNKNYFSDEKYQIVFNFISRWFDKFKTMPSKDELKIIVDKTKEDSEVKFLLNSIIDTMYDNKEEINYDYLEEELVSFIKENRVYEAMAMAQADIDKGNFAAIVNKMEDAVRVSFDKDLGMSIRDVNQAFEKVNKLNNEVCISSGFPNLDSILDGGFHPKETYNFSGIPGAGKTLILGNFALNAFAQEKKVLVYTFETSFERLFMRYVSNLSGMSKKEIFLDENGVREKLASTFDRNITGDLIIKEYNANSVCSNDIMAHVNDLWMYKKWKPDIIVIDYLLIMATNDKSLSTENSYKYYKTVTEEVRNIGKTFYVPVLTASQINREGQSEQGGSKAMVTSKSISESRGILDTIDFLAIILQTAKDKTRNKLCLYVDKNRNDRNGIRIEYEVDYNTMKLTEGAIF
jgi:replicative DNA helicase